MLPKIIINSLMLIIIVLLPLQSFAHPPWWSGDYEDADSDSDWSMMGGMGMRHGMMGMRWSMGVNPMGMGGMPRMLMTLNLSDEQQQKINNIQDKLQKDHWQTMGKIMDAQVKLREAWSADKPDPKKVGAAFENISKLQREALEARVVALNKMYDVLSDEQREQLKSWQPGSTMPMGWGAGHRGGRMMMH